MPKRTIRRELGDVVAQMLDAIERCERFIDGMSYDEFRNDDRTHFAVIRSLEIVSEASRDIPKSVKSKHNGIPWHQIADSGNVYRHIYDKVSLRIVWDTASVDLPSLKAMLLAIDHESATNGSS